MKKEILRMEHISKSFQGVKILDNINLNLFKGEILGLTGLNNSGKTTLLKILLGLYENDSGTIYLNNNTISISSIKQALDNGIFCIGQDSMLISNLSIRENIFAIGKKQSGKLIINKNQMFNQTKILLEKLELHLDPDLLISHLSLEQNHLIQICKAISLNSKILILDSITGSYNKKDFIKFKKVLSDLCNEGISIIYVNNKLDEVFDIADRITILKDGKNLRTIYKDEYIKENVITLLTGNNLINKYIKTKSNIGEEFLKIENLSSKILKDLNFSIKRGEILGFAGCEEPVRNELEKTLFGMCKNQGIKLHIEEKKITLKNPRDAIKCGIGLIPEYASRRGYFQKMKISHNINFLIPFKIGGNFIINKQIGKYITKTSLEKMGLSDLKDTEMYNLSYLNKLKLVIEKWMIIKPKLLIFVNPTNGIDMVAKEEIYTIITEISKMNIAVILISNEFSELIKLSDRIIIFDKGQVKGEILKEESLKIEVLKEKFSNLLIPNE